MSIEPRTATVNVLVTKTLEVPEPEWCSGHRTNVADFKTDVTHYGIEHVIPGPDGTELARAMLSQSPFSQTSSSDMELYIESGDFTGSYSPDEVEVLADAFVQAADRLRALGRDLADRLTGGEPS